jgi:hypothetical protein
LTTAARSPLGPQNRERIDVDEIEEAINMDGM